MRRFRSGGRCWSGSGFPTSRASLDSADPYRVPASRRRTGVLVGSRAALRDPFVTLPFPERRPRWPRSPTSPSAQSRFTACTSPTRPTAGSRPHARGCSHRASARAEHGPSGVRRPQHPATRARERGGSLLRERLTRATAARARTQWDEAELGVVPGLRDLGYRDAYRPSTATDRASRAGPGSASRGMAAAGASTNCSPRPSCDRSACIYHHAWRDEGLSDHSALEADIVPGSGGQLRRDRRSDTRPTPLATP